MENYGAIQQRGFLSKKRGGTITGDTLYNPAGAIDQLTEVTNKSYVDALVAGLIAGKQLTGVLAATVNPLSACTAAGAEVGKTLTVNVAEVLVIDGVTISLNARVLIQDQVATKDNGVYTLTTVGTVVIPWVLTRATDLDQTAEAIPDVWLFSTSGTVNHDAGFKIDTVPAILDTDPLIWVQFTGSGGAFQPCEDLSAQAGDGTPTIFNLSTGYAVTSLKVYVNGIRQRLGAGNDYVETTPATGVFTFTAGSTPVAGDAVLVDLTRI